MHAQDERGYIFLKFQRRYAHVHAIDHACTYVALDPFDRGMLFFGRTSARTDLFQKIPSPEVSSEEKKKACRFPFNPATRGGPRFEACHGWPLLLCFTV